MPGRDPARGARDTGRTGGSPGNGGSKTGKGSDREDRDIARQIDNSRGLPGSEVGGRASDPKGPPGSGPTHYNERFDTYVSRTPIAQRNLEQAVKDYNDRTIMEKIGSVLGIGQVDPTTDPNFNAATHNAPQTSFDALGAGLGLAGLATGLPLGSAYDIGKSIYAQGTGTNPTFGEVTLGDFGQAPQPGYGNLPGIGNVSSQTDPNEGPFGGTFGGGGTGAGADSTNGMGSGSPSHGPSDRPGKDPKVLIAEAMAPQQPPIQNQNMIDQQYVPAIQAPSNWQGTPAINAPANGPQMPVSNYPGMRWIGGGMASRPLYG